MAAEVRSTPVAPRVGRGSTREAWREGPIHEPTKAAARRSLQNFEARLPRLLAILDSDAGGLVFDRIALADGREAQLRRVSDGFEARILPDGERSSTQSDFVHTLAAALGVDVTTARTLAADYFASINSQHP